MKLHWILLSVIALLSFSVMVTFITYAGKKGFPLPFILFGITAISAVFYFFQTLTTTQFKWHVPFSMIILLLFMGILSFVGNWAQFQAAATAPNPGLAIAVVSLQSGLIALLAVIFFGNSLTTFQLVGLITALVGIILISVGARR